MDFATLLVGLLLLALPLAGTGLLAAIIMLERAGPLSAATANGAPGPSAHRRPRRKAARRRH
jgi:hypothetical protein